MKMIDSGRIKDSLVKAAKALWNAIPILIGVMLLVSLVGVLIPPSVFAFLFHGQPLLDLLIGSLLGSVLTGNPITSYIIGGELLDQGVSLLAVTAFIVAWVTVGIVQLPAEALLLGKRFAIVRNITAFFFAILVALLTVLGVSLL